MRQKNKRGQPIDPVIKGLIQEMILEVQNLKETKRILKERCELDISYPTLIKFAHEVGFTGTRGRPKENTHHA